MKKVLMLVLFLIPVVAHAQEDEGIYPWVLTMFGGGAAFCDEDGCFGPTGFAAGASFGRAMGNTWSFELEGTYARTTQDLPPRFDIPTGIFFTPELQRTRIWGGGTFMAKIARFGDRNNMFVSLSLIGGYEEQKEKAPEGVFVQPTRDIGIKGGAAGGAGMNFWFSDTWGLRPEVRFYLVAGDLSGLRYTAGLMKQF
ncbi:MAG TPA: hypothetical protein VLH08_10100 [Acidobacteriota bacterium]|jgi:hypothetical protein|nr:hypothetical protein [Acidobacteriota bacterium]